MLTKEELDNITVTLSTRQKKNEKRHSIVSVNTNHKGVVLCICKTADGRIATASVDKTIKILNTIRVETEITIEGHTDWINNISLLDNGNLVSSSRDKTVRIWEISDLNYKSLAVLTEHEGEVYQTIQLSQNRIGSCSEDKTIKIWKSDPPYELVQTLKGESPIMSLLELKNKKYIVSLGAEICFWNNENYQCERTILTYGCPIRRNYFVEGNNDTILFIQRKEIMIIDAITFKMRTKLHFNDEDWGDFYYVFEHNNLLGLGEDKNGDLLIFDTVQRKLLGKRKNFTDYEVKGILLLDDNKKFVTFAEEKLTLWKSS